MDKVFGALVASLLVVLLVTVALPIPSFFAGIALWYAWNSLLGAFVATSLPQVGFLHCWATAFCVGWVAHYLQRKPTSKKDDD